MNNRWDYCNSKSLNNTISKYKFKREYEFITKYGEKNLNKILDIAGGSGHLAIPLSQFSSDITIVDVSEAAIKQLHEKNSKIKAIHSDFTSAQITAKFSLIICIESICYFDDIDAFIFKVKNLMKADGVFVLSCVNPKSWRYYLREISHFGNGSTPYNEFTLKELTAVLNKHGLKIDQIEGMNWIPLPLSSNSKFAKLFELFEQVFYLKRWLAQSPWWLISIKKSS